jgi:hypothetical protein
MLEEHIEILQQNLLFLIAEHKPEISLKSSQSREN